jgi:2-dehydro-3-deoxygluconokinase
LSGALVTLGELLGSFKSLEVGTLRVADRFELEAAGSEGNVAVGLARLGSKVKFIGRVGDDDIGRALDRALRGEGVELKLVVDKSQPTGLLVSSTPALQTSRVSYSRSQSAGSKLSSDDFSESDFSEAKILHITGITLALSDSCRKAVEAAISIAEKLGILVSLDVNYRSKLWSRSEAALAIIPILKRCHFVFAGIDEARLILGDPKEMDPKKLARGIHNFGPKSVVITDSERGAWHSEIDGQFIFQSARPAALLEASGAGDAFVAGFLSAQLKNLSTRESLEIASICGARACEARGDWRNAPTSLEVSNLLSSPISDEVDR